jgi:hypothetical protein
LKKNLKKNLKKKNKKKAKKNDDDGISQQPQQRRRRRGGKLRKNSRLGCVLSLKKKLHKQNFAFSKSHTSSQERTKRALEEGVCACVCVCV